jgi:hypothetical protein
MVAYVEVSSLMPLVIHPRVRKVIGRVAAMTCVAVFGSTGAAFAACQNQPVSQPFAHWGDNSSYFLVPGGSFEGTPGQVGWSLSDASLTPGNEPFDVHGASDDQTLTVDSGGSATSPGFCVDRTMQDLRFFARETAPGSDLEVQGVLGFGRSQFVWPLAVVKDGSLPSWAPVRPIELRPRFLPSWMHLSLALRFVARGGDGSWQIDDVYVDPFRLG